MMFEVVNMSFALPEMFLLGMACTILLVVAFFKKTGASLAYGLSQITMVASVVLVYRDMGGLEGLAFSDTYIRDALSNVLKIAIFLINIAVLMYSTSYLKARELFKGEYYVLAVFATLGMSVMVSAHHFLTLYLGLELMSLCLYAMVAMHRDSKVATEANEIFYFRCFGIRHVAIRYVDYLWHHRQFIYFSCCSCDSNRESG